MVVGSEVAEGDNVAVGVTVGIAVCVSANAVHTAATAVSITSVGFVLNADEKPLHDVNVAIIRNNGIIVLLRIFIFYSTESFLEGKRPTMFLPARTSKIQSTIPYRLDTSLA